MSLETMYVVDVEDIEDEDIGVQRLTRDLRTGAEKLTTTQARFLVDYYYTLQDQRIRAKNQHRSAEDDEPAAWVDWISGYLAKLEGQIFTALDIYSDNQELGQWARSITGIGPVIAAGLLAHIDINMTPHPGALWRYAGLDPTNQWNKKEKRPWNARLKVLAWKIGESMVKQQNRRPKNKPVGGDFYGKMYVERREIEEIKNLNGEFEEQAKAKAKTVGKDTKAYGFYSKGQLPPGHLYSRAKRWAVKIFLSHYHHVGYEILHGKPPDRPWILVHGDHSDFIPPPNW